MRGYLRDLDRYCEFLEDQGPVRAAEARFVHDLYVRIANAQLTATRPHEQLAVKLRQKIDGVRRMIQRGDLDPNAVRHLTEAIGMAEAVLGRLSKYPDEAVHGVASECEHHLDEAIDNVLGSSSFHSVKIQKPFLG